LFGSFIFELWSNRDIEELRHHNYARSNYMRDKYNAAVSPILQAVLAIAIRVRKITGGDIRGGGNLAPKRGEGLKYTVPMCQGNCASMRWICRLPAALAACSAVSAGVVQW
jgi:hypothetical protein